MMSSIFIFLFFLLMKVLPFKIPKPELHAVVFQEDKDDLFYNKLHQHEEIQISLIVKGEGSLIVGDTINFYNTDDIFIIGSHLPHVFMSNNKALKESHMLTVFFSKSSFGNPFFELGELKDVSAFFKRSQFGFKLKSKKKMASNLINELEHASRFEKLIILLQLLKIGSEARYTSLSSFIYDKAYSDDEGERMRNVFEFTMTHFHTQITLQLIAEVANMTKNAFCKYFKKRTNKTYLQFLNELRVEHASQLLRKNVEQPIAEISELSGFNNLSNFNRQFKNIKGFSPSWIRKQT